MSGSTRVIPLFGLSWRRAVPVLLLLLVCPIITAADDLGSARLLISGTDLTVSPESQTVPFNTPTVVETSLVGYDTNNGVLPDDLRVLADFTGPEIDGILVLETRPNQPFRIPRLSLKGEYLLDNIRLVQGEELLSYAQPRSATVLVTQVLVTRVTSRALTEDEIRSYGIVVDDDNFHAFSFTFGFAVDGEVYDYSIPVYQSAHGVGLLDSLEGTSRLHHGGGGTTSPRFRPPQMAPFTLELKEKPERQIDTGGCENPFGCTDNGTEDIRLPGVLLFPTDISLLNQYFSVVLMAQNGAPEGDPLVIRDLTAKATLPPGLRMAETQPPTVLGVPVPVRVPGADGQVGTADDLTFLVAQASGEAEILVEGRKEGTHIVEFDLEGVLEGLPDGSIRRIEGSARGAVVVRDPSLGVTITHPSVVRVDEEYDLRLVVSNTSNAPVNLVTVALPASKLSGVEVVGDSEKPLPSLLPGESEIVEFRMRPLRTGRVVASSVRSPYQVDPRFELTVGVGELGIPLSPDAIVLPDNIEELPDALVGNALSLIGLSYSLATAPAADLDTSLPRMDLAAVDEKVYWLSQAGRHISLGEDPFDALAVLAAEWTGARREDWEWDRLRRGTSKGGLVASSLSAAFADEAAVSSDRSAFRRFAATTAFLGPVQGALASGSGARLEVSSLTSGLAVAGDGVDPLRRRELPFADLYAWDGAQMALLAAPEEGGHQVRLTDSDGGTTDLELLVTDTTGALRAVRWDGVSVGAGGLAIVDFTADQSDFTLYVDFQGDGVVDQTLAGTVEALSRRPFSAVAAVQKESVVSGHVLEVLFTGDVDLGELIPSDPARFQLPGNTSNGGLVAREEHLGGFNWVVKENLLAGMRNTRVVQVAFSNPVSPYLQHDLSISDVSGADGTYLAQTTLPVVTNLAQPGGMVEGQVIGPDGLPVPFAKVELLERDSVWITGECPTHRTAAVISDADGRFRFEYVRTENCGQGAYRLRATDPQTGRRGESAGRVRFAGQVHDLDVVMLGRGIIRGRVTYEDGTVPEDPRVVAYSPVFTQGVEARILADGTYEARDVPVGTVSLGASDRLGGIVYQTVEIPVSGAVVERDLTILRLSPQTATGDVRGTVYQVDGTTPAADAYLALYVDGELVGVERSAEDGGFDFGTVPAGLAEIEGFDGVTGLAGVFVQFNVLPDQVNDVNLFLQDERGAVEGFVYRRGESGTVPVAGAVVWVDGTPFNTVTDSTGAYRMDGVFTGNRTVYAADLERQEQTAELVTITEGADSYRDLYFIDDFGEGGITGEVLGFSGNPVPGAIIHLGNSNDQRWWYEVAADTLGRFSIPDLGPGTYVLNAISGEVGVRQEVKVRFQGDTPFASLRFKKGTIRGQTVAPGEYGEPVPVTSVITYKTTVVNEGLVGPAWQAQTLETDAQGYFEIPDVLAGPYTLTVNNAFQGEQTVRGELVFHGEVVEHEISFQRNGSIGGVILDVDGETPVEGAVVHLRHPSFSDYDLVTDAEGRFLFDLVPPAGRFPIDVEYEAGAIFRRSRVWVNYSQHGLDLDLEVSLAAQGSVGGWVEDASGNPVPGAAVTLREHAHPRRTLEQTADEQGFYNFTNVFRGRVTIDAQAPSLGGLGGRTMGEVTTDGEQVWTLIALEGAGEITGRVLSPVDGEPVASAQVTLYKWLGGILDSATTDETGSFRFRLLPEGLYRVWAFDPRTGRHGAWDSIAVDEHGQVVDGEVTLEVRGEVEGRLIDPDDSIGVPGATIALRTESLVRFTTYASTDTEGDFEFIGIPEGQFDLTTSEPEGRRRARGSGTISEEGERVTVDLTLEATGSVTGTVLAPAGAPAGLFANSNTVIREGGYVVGATLDNPYTFEGLIVGRPFTLESWEVGGEHRGKASGVVSEQGQVVEVDVTMQPIGSVTVTVTDSFGGAVPGADLELKSSGFYGSRRLFAGTGGDGTADFQEIGEGHLSAYVINPVNSLRGSGSGRLTLDGENVQISVQLEDSARVHGRLMLADGATPAVDTLVVATIGNRSYQIRADENGDFDFPSVPLGGFEISAQEYFGPGYREVDGTTTSNGEVVDLGILILDDADPELLAHVPESGAQNLPLSASVVLQFSEPLDVSRFSTSWFKFKKLSGSNVGYGVAWSDGNATATLTPTSPLANFTAYEVIVQNAYDAAGRDLKERVKLVFNTVDQVPPGVVDALPRDGQVQVAVDTDLRIAFSEPVVLESLSGTSLQLTDLSTGAGLTTTFQLLPGERQVLITPQQLLATDTTYQLTVQSVTDGSGNAMAAPVTVTFDTIDTLPPTIDSVSFPSGTTFESGDDLPVSVTATDPHGVAEILVHVDDWTVSDPTSPYDLVTTAPVRAAVEQVTVTVEARDVYGNAGTTTRTVQVSPHANGTPPTLAALCGLADHVVVPGIETELSFAAGDDESLERLRLLVDGVEVDRVDRVLDPDREASFLWSPPSDAVAGDSWAVRFEARDFAGNLTTHDLVARVPAGTILVGARSLFDTYQGQDVVLAEGDFLAREPLSFGSLTLVRGGGLLNGEGLDELTVTTTGDLDVQCGVTLSPVRRVSSGGVVSVSVGGTLTVESGASLDASDYGYAGGNTSGAPGQAPSWVTPSQYRSGGSHGGRGLNDVGGSSAGEPGEVYGSVYEPGLAGGGGSYRADGRAGGGMVEVVAASLVLEGEIVSGSDFVCGDPAGAGGSVLLRVGTLSGAGMIRADGGDSRYDGCGGNPAGGGGRVAIYVDTLDGFDPATQASAIGGHGLWDQRSWSASAGTVYVKQLADTYGSLRIDNNSAITDVAPTELPQLGSGAVGIWEVSGSDAWLTGAAPFHPRWEGAWLVLLDGSGAELGAFQVVARDSTDRVLLAGAGGVSAAASYRGEYRFDKVEVLDGAGLKSVSPVVTDRLETTAARGVEGDIRATELEFSGGDVEIGSPLTAANLRVVSGTAVRSAVGQPLALEVSGTLTVEAGASLDASDRGYAGGVGSQSPGTGPSWVTPSTYRSGASHGGSGITEVGSSISGVPGEVYGSVYQPRLAGAGGSDSPRYGGGVIDVSAGSLVLEGEIVTGSTFDCGEEAGAGGSVLLQVGTLSGAGQVRADGGASTVTGCGSALAGGGGRVAIYADDLTGFDPVNQVSAVGGRGWWDSRSWKAATGTIYVKTLGDTYGDLWIKGDVYTPEHFTELPELGVGSVTQWETSGADAWLTGDAAFHPRWGGTWVVLLDGGGGELGTFEVIDRDGTSRLLLAGAGAVAAAASYRGEYRFDQVTVLEGAGLKSTSTLIADSLDTADGLGVEGDVRVAELVFSGGDVEIGSLLTATNVRVTSGTVLRSAVGQPLALEVSGTLTIEAGASLDASDRGYAGGVGSQSPGTGPSWVTPSTYRSGASHGGSGITEVGSSISGVPGEVYGSVYQPRLAGAGGSDSPRYGGGVIDVSAGSLVLEGEIVTGSTFDCGEEAGAGGSVLLQVGTLSGAGQVRADGGASTVSGCGVALAGGGGRVAIYADDLAGFDPATQVSAVGGRGWWSGRGWKAAAGTVYVKTPADTYGSLWIKGDVYVPEHSTELPELGAGTVALWQTSGADAWLTGDAAFHPRWDGAWVVVLDGSGGELGTFQVVDRDGTSRLLLAGAAGVSGAAAYQGEYRFDRVEVTDEASLTSSSTVVVSELSFAGSGSLEGPFEATDVTLSAGAVLQALPSQALIFDIPGTLTVEAGAVMDVSGSGYLGGTSTIPAGAPDWVQEATAEAGGSHGGSGLPDRWGSETDLGEVYGSVYRPALAGAGGAASYTTRGGTGGGVFQVRASALVLDGEIRAEGASSCDQSSAAGGSILVEVGTLSGSGRLSAAGAHDDQVYACEHSTAGGGGRVAVYADQLVGFDPATQVTAQGGWSGEGSLPDRSAAPGTVYVKLPSDTYGTLRIDAGLTVAGGAALAAYPTELPDLGSGAVAAWEVSGADAWLTGAVPFHPRWDGAWVVLRDDAGAELGGFRVADRDGTSRLLLEGAGAVAGAASIEGEYRFDLVEIVEGADLLSDSPVVAGILEASGALSLDNVVAHDMTVPTGAELRPRDQEGLRLILSGTLTVESGATIDATGMGYAGGYSGHVSGYGPEGVTTSTFVSGGSHGGQGRRHTGTAGEVYGSLHAPTYGGGGGSKEGSVGAPGGGVVEIEADHLVLNGDILAGTNETCYWPSGAGGSVWLRLNTLSGTGQILANGGSGVRSGCSDTSAGGGGRVAIYADDLTTFDVETQVQARGGLGGLSAFAAPGTIFLRSGTDTYGHLFILQGSTSEGVLETVLPSVGRDLIGWAEVDSVNPADLWIEPQDPATLFGLGVEGTWVRVAEQEYLVVGQTTDRRRILLQDAAGLVAVGDEYLGLHRFDSLTIRGKASLRTEDGLLVEGTTTLDAGSTISSRDLGGPQVTVTSPVSGTAFYSGQSVQMAADVSDESTITQVTFALGDQTVTDTEAPWEGTLPAPAVSVDEIHTVHVTATDSEGNVGSGSVDIQVDAVVSGSPPTVALTCPSVSAPLIPAAGLDLTFSASHADGIDRVELLVGDDPTVVASLHAPPFTFRVTPPAGSTEGDVVTFRGRARSFAGTTAEATYSATVTAGAVITADTYLGPSDASLEGQSVAVAAGTLTVEGAHSFRDLVVLDGASLSHPDVSPGAENGLDLAVTRDVYVSCGGSVDATGRGWKGGMDRRSAEDGAPYFVEEFDGGLSVWQKNDYTTYSGPSNWYVHSNGYLAQTTNIHDPGGAGVGSDLLYADGASLSDFRLSFRMNSGDDDGVGLVFRYQDQDNFYRLLMNNAGSFRRLEKRVNGVWTTLASDGVRISRSTWHEVELVAEGDRFTVWMNGEKILTAVDPTFTSGTFGFTVIGSAGAYYDGVLLRQPAAPDPGTGGSHAGRGGAHNGSSPVQGNPFDPRGAGAGGGGRLAGAGGGVIRLQVDGTLTVDGAVSASAAPDTGTEPFGAGGSVRLDATAIQGLGVIDASGGGDGTARAAGSGGRISLFGATVDPGLVSRTTALGGAASTGELTGAAGTIFVKRDAQAFGDLILDNAGRATDQITELASVLPGTVESVGVDTLYDTSVVFPEGLRGTELTVDERPGESWPVLGRTVAADGLVLDVSSAAWTGQPGETYRVSYTFDSVTVHGGSRGVTRATVTGTTDVDGTSSWRPGHLPELTFTTPLDGDPVSAGQAVTFQAGVDDDFDVDAVRLEFGTHSLIDDETPFSWTVIAPPVASPTLMPATLEAVDGSGYTLRTEIELQVLPASDPSAPTVTLGDMPRDGYVVLPDQSLGLDFTVADAESLYAWRVRVDGAVVDEALSVDATTVSGTVGWAPPQSPAGAVYVVAVEAEDYGGNLTVATRQVSTPAGTVLTGSQALSDPYVGQDLVLGSGTFTASALQPASLTLLDGAVLTHAAGGSLDLDVAGPLKVQSGAIVDVRYLGYSGATSSNPAGVPPNIAPATDESGGHHGGTGMRWYTTEPTHGEVYGSVYRPRSAGGGGALDNDGSGNGGTGGGVLDITADSVMVDGVLYANGLNSSDAGRPAGAGGTVSIVASSLSGGGEIHAMGGYARSCHYARQVGAGGGGRIALHVDDLSGFDVSGQTRAEGGGFYGCSWERYRYAGAGTVYVRSTGSTYGDLLIDNGTESDGASRSASVATPLPSLGVGAVGTTEVAGTDLWVSAASMFKDRWLGAWMVLEDAVGTELGGFEVVEVDGGGRVRLSGAASVSPPSSWRGEYRFDSVTLDHGSGLETGDRTVVGEVSTQDGGWLSGQVEAATIDVAAGATPILLGSQVRSTTMTVRSGALVSPLQANDPLRLTVAGTLTIEDGAWLQATALGYAGETSSAAAGVPAGVAPATNESGGHHGGPGSPWYVADGSYGEAYDSVYYPHLAGGGGALDNDGSGNGGFGGGIIEIEAGAVQLDGDIRVIGYDNSDTGSSGGGGGTVRVEAASMAGGGNIYANGGTVRSCRYQREVGAGGGGRVALWVDDLSAFDADTQVWAKGGTFYSCSWSRLRYAGAGTVFTHTATSTYGDLRIDNGLNSAGQAQTNTLPTELPLLGQGAVIAADIEGSDLWVEGPTPFLGRWLGVWMALEDGIGGDLGTYRVLEIDAAGRVRLEGAAGIAGATAWSGEYHFDRLVLDHGAGLETGDRLVVDDVVTREGGWLSGPIEAARIDVEAGAKSLLFGADIQTTDLIVRSGAEVSPQGVDGLLRLNVPGTLTIESGGWLRATASGYAGATSTTAAGVPAGVAPATDESGGHHGGPGSPWYVADGSFGETFDSVYHPHLAGGGGALDNDGSGNGGPGGGIIEVVAGSVQLDGDIRVIGYHNSDTGSSGGGGGSVRVEAGSMAGTGNIYANGGNVRSCHYAREVGAGGGGRVALWVDDLSGFDADSQVWAKGGTFYSCSWTPLRYAGAGTVFTRTATSTYGDLRIDNGFDSAGQPQTDTLPTVLPVLGQGTVVATEVAGSDLWVEGSAPFLGRWLGAWMVLTDGANVELGPYRVSEIDVSGRILLDGAAGSSAAVAWSGLYRFDTIVLDHGAGLETSDPVSSDQVVAKDAGWLAGDWELTDLEIQDGTVTTLLGNEVRTTDMTLRSGALVSPHSSDGRLRIELPGTLTIESGAKLSVSAKGYAGATSSTPAGAPAGVSPASDESGGNHGGPGMRWYTSAATGGEVYGSVYYPDLAGGGGALDDDGSGNGGSGAGVVEIIANAVILDGRIDAIGYVNSDSGSSGGGGGAVFIDAASMSGSGFIYALGGYSRSCHYARNVGAGGGGRVALWVDDLTAFDSDSQAWAYGGTKYSCSWVGSTSAAPGSVFVFTTGSTYGNLRVDNGVLSYGDIRSSSTSTPLPLIGSGDVGYTEVDTDDPGALWIEPTDPTQTFTLGVTGAWLRVGGIDYRIVGQSSDLRRVLLDGAAGIVSTGDTFAGVYKFDLVKVRNNSTAEFLDTAEIGTVDTESGSQVITP